MDDEAQHLPACPFTRSPGGEEEGPSSVTAAQVTPSSVTHQMGNARPLCVSVPIRKVGTIREGSDDICFARGAQAGA